MNTPKDTAEASKVLDEMRAALYDKPQDKRFPVNVSLDELNIIHTALSAQQAGWREMSDAPKDGTEILVAIPKEDKHENGYLVGHAMFMAGVWMEPYNHTEVYEPFKWQPLPLAPEVGDR